jgi:hypothetical protein
MKATERGVKTVQVNRAPVMSLWGAVVAERLGHDPETALGLGEAVSVLNARSKGRRLGVFGPSKPRDETAAEKKRRSGEGRLELMGRPVPVVMTPRGPRAVIGGTVIDPAKVRRKLEQKFGDALPAVRGAMEDLAKGFTPPELAAAAYPLYERFRPTVPPGTKGWGARGQLDLDLIRSLAPRAKPLRRTKPVPARPVKRRATAGGGR